MVPPPSKDGESPSNPNVPCYMLHAVGGGGGGGGGGSTYNEANSNLNCQLELCLVKNEIAEPVY